MSQQETASSPAVRPAAGSVAYEWIQTVIFRYSPVWLFFLLWELCSRLGVVDPFFIPPFSRVLATFANEFFAPRGLLFHGSFSAYRLASGFVLGVSGGVALGILMGRLRLVERVFDPLISAFNPIPKLALFPIMMVLIGIGDASKITLILLGCFFPVVISTYAGVKSIDKYLIWNARTKGANEFQVLRTVVLPAALPYIFSGLRVSTAIGFVLIVASELIAANEGLGYLIINAERNLHLELMFAGVFFLAAMGFLADRTLLMFGRILFAWQDQDD